MRLIASLSALLRIASPFSKPHPVAWVFGALLAFTNVAQATESHNFKQGVDVSAFGVESYRDVAMLNWAQNVQFTPELVFYPKNRDELVAIVKGAAAHGKRITMMGKGHSWNPLMEGSDYLISTLHLTAVTPHPETTSVTVEACATIREVDDIIRPYGLMVPCNIVGTTDITYGGIMATGSHGSGRFCPSMSDFIDEIELVRADGQVETLSEATHGPEIMSAARLNLGLFGVMYKITFRVAQSFNVEVQDRWVPRAKLFEVLPQALRDKENVEALWFPFTDHVVLKSWNRTSKPTTPVTWTGRAIERMKKDALYYLFEYFISGMFVHHPSTIPTLIRSVGPYIFPQRTFVTDVNSAIHYVNEATKYPIHETEIALPFDDANLGGVQAGWTAMTDAVFANQKRHKYPLNIVVHMRFLAGSQALLSPSFGNERTCYMDFGSYYRTPGWRDLVNEVWDTWRELPGVKLHWAKDMRAYKALDVPAMYGPDNVQRFLAIREVFDPTGVFANDFMRGLFHIEPAPQG